MAGGGVRQVVVVVVQEGTQEPSALVAEFVRTHANPFAGHGLNEAFGLAVDLRVVGASKQVPQPKLAAGAGKEPGTVRSPPGSQRPDYRQTIAHKVASEREFVPADSAVLHEFLTIPGASVLTFKPIYNNTC